MDALRTALEGPRPGVILLVSATKVHRAYRDARGRFTLEQCNLDDASGLTEYSPSSSFDASDLDRCEHCFL